MVSELDLVQPMRDETDSWAKHAWRTLTEDNGMTWIEHAVGWEKFLWEEYHKACGGWRKLGASGGALESYGAISSGAVGHEATEHMATSSAEIFAADASVAGSGGLASSTRARTWR